MTPTRSLPILKGNLTERITLDQALKQDCDILHRLTYPEKRLDFCSEIYQSIKNGVFSKVLQHHLGLPSSRYHIPWVNEWLHGSFNICIPIYVDEKKKYMMRLPLPYKVGEASNSGNVEEKLRCEVAMYAYIATNHAAIPIPELLGFSFATSSCFTAMIRAPLLLRACSWLRRSLQWLTGNRRETPFLRHDHGLDFPFAYMLIEYVSNGDMLSAVWDEIDCDSAKRATLYADLARIMLSLASVPFSRIGSLKMDNDGTLSLSNRPLLYFIHQFENEGISTGLPRDLTYSASDLYILDTLSCHDNRIASQPNSMYSEQDAHEQLASLTMMRALLGHHLRREHRHGPFALQLTDLHPSNIFVDRDGHITNIIDLEWACVLPVELLRPPHWLTQRAIDMLEDEDLLEYDQRRQEFMSACETAERRLTCATTLTDIMQESWERGSFWYFHAITSCNAVFNLFTSHIQESYGPQATTTYRELNRSAWPYWRMGTTRFVERKLQERGEYLQRVRDLFEKAGDVDTADEREDVSVDRSKRRD
ncbi:hypothetical protein BDZ85DRAFT_227284 [Elsinoe ampelina]|uniref:Uncharacterized protein n=1 Tax=Elsinoe ampelina TaxID=302913 RepID=A0A6A6FXR2_9PEZI|nr:hypothetical protein BDZ85DRAFT_227284 [Elsinoe ampelina]